MSYSNFAMHCHSCNEIIEPIHKNRQPNGSIKAGYRCECDSTFQQVFAVNHESPTIEEPEENEEKQKPAAPEGNVLDWKIEEERDSFIKWYGIEAYKSLVSKAVKNDGFAEYKAPEDEPDMPQVEDARKWTPKQRDNFIEKYSREKYQERLSNAYKADREPVEG